MNSLSFLDHALSLLIFVAFPTYSALTIKSVFAAVRKDGEPARLQTYRHTVASTLVLALAVISAWFVYKRPWPELGFRWPEPMAFSVGLAVALFVVWIFVQPLKAMAAKKELAAELSPKYEGVGLLLPFSKREEIWFRGVSINAGISEEIIYRGYLIWYLSQIVPELAAATLAVVMFALAHLYQGWKQVPGILLVSAVAVALYVATDSLLVPVIFHITLDAAQGYYISKARQAVLSQNEVGAKQG